MAKIAIVWIKEQVSTDAIFAHKIKKLSALAFVPVDNVIFAFEELINSKYYVDNEEELRRVVDYYEDTWIGRPTRGGKRRAPTFPIKIWNMFDSVTEDSPRTNNAVERWHRAFNSALTANHVTVWKFINMLKRKQGLQEVKMEQKTAGTPQQKKRRKYKNLDEWLIAVVKGYDETNNNKYLKSIAHNLV
jgi:hypothetical protein